MAYEGGRYEKEEQIYVQYLSVIRLVFQLGTAK
jgi:hypothetical protein